MKKNNNKGFTLAELLIVVAIIAVLVAIAIPIFTSQLEKAREATDASNIRGAYAEVAAAALTDPETGVKATIEKKQQQNDWQSASSMKDIAGVDINKINSTDDTVVEYTAATKTADGKITIDGQEVTSSFLDSTGSSDSGSNTGNP